jgi:hypothetical protein
VIDIEMKALTRHSRITHLPIPSNVNVDSIVNGFQTVAGASTVSNSVVTERRPGMNTRQHTVCARRYVRLGRTKNAMRLVRIAEF